MYMANGYVCGGMPQEPLSVRSVKPLPDRMMLILFSNGEQRLFDATILNGPAFAPLQNLQVFMAPELDRGVVTWAGGELDCAPEYMYENSYAYSLAV